MKRRWRIPPPLVESSNGPGPEGLLILDEFRSELGVLLWKSLRSVTVWAETDPAFRRDLFDSDAADRRQLEILSTGTEVAPGIREALEDLLPVLARPDQVDPEFVGIVCSRIAAWAEGHGAPNTQLEFLQAAALCCPANAVFALAVGRRARDLAHYGRAEAWYYRSIGLARQAVDWETYVKAYLSHGTMLLRRGALPAARRSFIKALRRSRRQGLREGTAMALHDLFILEGRSGNHDQAVAYAHQAVEAHGSGHARLPALANDIAYFWLEAGYWAHSLPVFLEVLPKVRPEHRPMVLGSLARAAAGVQDSAAYDWARTELREYAPAPGIAEAWVDVARAALLLDRPEEARESALFAESVARSRREGQIRFLAESVMDQVEAELRAMASRSVEPAEDPTSNRLARDLIRTLQDAPAPEHQAVAG